MTREFEHYHGCNRRDPDNCGACALTNLDQDAPNYAGWPLAYMENRRVVPRKWKSAFEAEFARTDNDLYVANLKHTRTALGVRFEGDRAKSDDDEPRNYGRFEDSPRYRADMIDAGRGRLVR